MANTSSAPVHPDAFRYGFRAMGSPCALQLFAGSRAQADMAAALAAAEVERIEKTYSRYRPDSVLSMINRAAAAGESFTVDDETAALLDYAFACHAKSDGLFDITAGVLRRAWDFKSGRLPERGAVDGLLALIGMDKLVWQRPHLRFTVPGMELDLGGIGKEYAVDRAATLLAEHGIDSGLIDLGGDLFALGPLPDGTPWRIGLRDPHDGARLLGEVALTHGALATSGDYERCLEIGGRRYSHILNPRTGWPVRGLSSVTALAPQCMVAGSATTITMLKQEDGTRWLAGLGVPHWWVGDDGRQGGNLAPAGRC